LILNIGFELFDTKEMNQNLLGHKQICAKFSRSK
jgi:hypothetical protein